MGSGPRAHRTLILAAAVAIATAWGSLGARGRDGAGGDARRGEAVFTGECAVCHSTIAGWHKEGPALAGVFGRRAGTAPEYTGYRALRGMNIVWSEDTLDAWLADPRGFGGRDTLMTVKLTDAAARADVIAYLRTLR